MTENFTTAVIPDHRFAVLDCTLEASQGVGEARRRGCLYALARYPNLKVLMTTDADIIVATDRIARTCRHLTEVDAVCGRVEPLASETAILAQMPSKEGADEAIYRDFVLQFYDLLACELHNPYPHHGEAAEASLACRALAWSAVGGFGDIRSGEDRDLIRRLRTAGFRVRHANEVRVQASCRLNGRAPGGMAEALRERLAGVEYLVDEALPPVACLIEQAKRGWLDAWPPATPRANRLIPADLPEEIHRLQDLLLHISEGQDVTGFPDAMSGALLSGINSSVTDQSPLPDRGSRLPASPAARGATQDQSPRSRLPVWRRAGHPGAPLAGRPKARPDRRAKNQATGAPSTERASDPECWSSQGRFVARLEPAALNGSQQFRPTKSAKNGQKRIKGLYRDLAR